MYKYFLYIEYVFLDKYKLEKKISIHSVLKNWLKVQFKEGIYFAKNDFKNQRILICF